MRVLLTEDNLELAKLTAKNLKKQGFAVDIAYSGNQALNLIRNEENYDVIILDLNLPDIEGTKLLKRCKSLLPQTPVIALTCRDSEEEKVTGIKLGFDDYLTKPFSCYELAARLNVLCRWQRKNPSKKLTFGPVTLFPQSQTVLVNNQLINTTLNEFRLLNFLGQNQGRTISPQEIITSVWDRNSPFDKAKLQTTLSRLRKKMGDKKKTIIKTVTNGYLVN